jgi:hypothetical protein
MTKPTPFTPGTLVYCNAWASWPFGFYVRQSPFLGGRWHIIARIDHDDPRFKGGYEFDVLDPIHAAVSFGGCVAIQER